MNKFESGILIRNCKYAMDAVCVETLWGQQSCYYFA